MKKLIVLFLLLTVPLMAQQLDYSFGYIEGGTAYSGAGLTFIDTTSGTTNNIYYDLNDYWLGNDISPLFSDDSVLNINSDRFIIGTFYCAFDNQGLKAPTTDSLKYTIKVYPGVYTTASKAFAAVDWGTAVTLETLETVNDQFTINNVYVHATKYKHYPPECIKIEIAPTGGAKTANCDDSTFVNWQFVYPEIYQIYKERK